MNSSKIKNGLLIGLIIILFSISILFIVLSFKPDLFDNLFSKNNSAITVENKPVVTLKDYNVYEFDNVSFRFIIANIDVTGSEVSLTNYESNEQYNLANSNSFITTLTTLGYDLSKYNLTTDKLKVGSNYVLIPITLKDTNNLIITSLDGTNQKMAFNLDNLNKDKSALGFVEKTENNKPVSNDNNQNKPNNENQNENSSGKEVVFGKLVEIASDKVLINNQVYGYPSNVRVFVISVNRDTSKVNRYVKSAVLKLKKSGQSISANNEKITVNGIKGENMLNNYSSNQGFLLFEINGSSVDLNDLSYDLAYDLAIKE